MIPVREPRTPAAVTAVALPQPDVPEGWAPLGPEDPTIIGPYLLVARLRPGGRAVAVYVGTPMEPGLGVDHVLIKIYVKSEMILRPGIAREVDQLRRVRSAYVAQVFGIIEAESAFAVIREYIPGTSLERLIDDNPDGLDWPPTLDIVDGLLEGLATIHVKDVVHGAVKPSNVIVGDRSVLVDVQLVEPVPQARWFPGQPTAERFESPEQRAGRPITEASDVYSWALVALAVTHGSRFQPSTGSLYIKPDTGSANRHLRDILDKAVREIPFRRATSAELLSETRRIRRPRREVLLADVFPEAVQTPRIRRVGERAEPAPPFSPSWIRREAGLLQTVARAPGGREMTVRRLCIGLGASNARFAALAGATAIVSLPLALLIDAVLGVFR